MKNDIIPPKQLRPEMPKNPTPQPSLPPLERAASENVAPAPLTTPEEGPKKRRLLLIVAAIAIFFIAILASGVFWYFSALQPVSSDTERAVFTIESGATPNTIASSLKDKNLIRSERAFLLYVRQQGALQKLQAGSYRLAPSDSVSEIVGQLLQGKAANFRITFYPGAPLFDPTDTPDEKRTDAYTMLRRAGYSDEEVRAGLSKQYDHPLLAGKPTAATLEGYVYGETYQFDSGATVEQIILHTFDVFYERIKAKGILEKLAEVDMTLYEAITLASIIEREVSGQLEDQRIVSQIFHRRLALGEPLGADATFMYVAQQRNQTPSISIDSPYNTRINKGLPPGPIAAPDIVALEAAVSPADTDYLFFVSGDDGTNHFARTNAEHEQNTRLYCTKLCTEIAP